MGRTDRKHLCISEHSRSLSRSTSASSARSVDSDKPNSRGGRGGSQPIDRGRSRSAARFKKSRTPCWFGRKCTRQDCWFTHPHGRIVDYRAPRRPFTRSRKRSARSTSSNSTAYEPSRQAPPKDGQEKEYVNASSSSSAYEHSPEAALKGHPEKQDVDATSNVRVSPPKLSFRIFVENKLDDSVSPAEALAKYSAFQHRILRQTADKLKTSGLVYDIYNPLALQKQHDARIQLACRLARSFMTDLEQRRYADLCLVATDSCSAVVNNGVCTIIGHNEAPHFAFDPNLNALCLSDVPPIVSVWDILLQLESQLGLVSASTPELLENRLSRAFRVRFESSEQCRTALRSVATMHFKENVAVTTNRVSSAQAWEASVMPPALSLPERISKDVGLSAQVIGMLDRMLNVPAEIPSSLLDQQGSPEMKLDLQVLYLRRVHNFCFYSCEWCRDQWQLYNVCGAAVLRSGAPTKAQLLDESFVVAGQRWIEKHESRLQTFIRTASFAAPSLPSVEEAPYRSYLEEGLSGKIATLRVDKFQCALCQKCFRGMDFVRTHLLKVHPHVLAEARANACADIAVSSYIADPDRPGWPPLADFVRE